MRRGEHAVPLVRARHPARVGDKTSQHTKPCGWLADSLLANWRGEDGVEEGVEDVPSHEDRRVELWVEEGAVKLRSDRLAQAAQQTSGRECAATRAALSERRGRPRARVRRSCARE